MSEGDQAGRLPVPAPRDERDLARDARVRASLDAGMPISREDRRWLAELPADKEIPAEVVARAAEQAGGIAPRRAILDATRRDEESQ